MVHPTLDCAMQHWIPSTTSLSYSEYPLTNSTYPSQPSHSTTSILHSHSQMTTIAYPILMMISTLLIMQLTHFDSEEA